MPAEKIVGVFGEIGVQAEAAEYVLAKLKERGEGVVAQCPKAACEKVAKAFTDIGLDAEARKIEVPASDYDGSDVMVLDEPTSAMDAEAEAEIFERVRGLTEDQMAILISHRFSTVRMADHIVVLEEGRVVESGDHATLLAHQGRYAHLFSLQAAGYR